MEKTQELLKKLQKDDYTKFKYGKEIETALAEIKAAAKGKPDPALAEAVDALRNIQATTSRALTKIQGKKGGVVKEATPPKSRKDPPLDPHSERAFKASK